MTTDDLRELYGQPVSRCVYDKDGANGMSDDAFTDDYVCWLESKLIKAISKRMPQPVCAVKDESCHWYVIPAERRDEFYQDDADNDFIDSGKFGEKWDKYRTGGSLNNIQLYAFV